MCSKDYNEIFWAQLENNMSQKIPEVIKNILARTGFESELSFRRVTSADITIIESCIEANKTHWMKKYSIIYGHCSNKSKFKLLPGHSKIIFQISEHYEKRQTSNKCKGKGEDRGEANVTLNNVSIG